MSVGKVSGRQNVCRRNVCRRNVCRRNILVPNTRVSKLTVRIVLNHIHVIHVASTLLDLSLVCSCFCVDQTHNKKSYLRTNLMRVFRLFMLAYFTALICTIHSQGFFSSTGYIILHLLTPINYSRNYSFTGPLKFEIPSFYCPCCPTSSLPPPPSLIHNM